MSAAQQSLNAVKAALQNAEARSEGSVARGQGEQPFVCATVGLRINDLKAVVAENVRLRAERDELDAEMDDFHRHAGGPAWAVAGERRVGLGRASHRPQQQELEEVMTAPYTLEEFLSEYQPTRRDREYDRLRATVEALAAKEAEVERLTGERDHFKAWCANREERVVELESKSIRYQIDLDNRARVAEARAEAAEARAKELEADAPLGFGATEHWRELAKKHAAQVATLTEESVEYEDSIEALTAQVRSLTEERDAARAEVADLKEELDLAFSVRDSCMKERDTEKTAHLATRREADRLREDFAAFVRGCVLVNTHENHALVVKANTALANTSEPAPRCNCGQAISVEGWHTPTCPVMAEKPSEPAPVSTVYELRDGERRAIDAPQCDECDDTGDRGLGAQYEHCPHPRPAPCASCVRLREALTQALGVIDHGTSYGPSFEARRAAYAALAAASEEPQ